MRIIFHFPGLALVYLFRGLAVDRFALFAPTDKEGARGVRHDEAEPKARHHDVYRLSIHERLLQQSDRRNREGHHVGVAHSTAFVRSGFSFVFVRLRITYGLIIDTFP